MPLAGSRGDRAGGSSVPQLEGDRRGRKPNEIRLREGAESLAVEDGKSPAGAAEAVAAAWVSWTRCMTRVPRFTGPCRPAPMR